jgi:hypothetical protein
MGHTKTYLICQVWLQIPVIPPQHRLRQEESETLPQKETKLNKKAGLRQSFAIGALQGTRAQGLLVTTYWQEAKGLGVM